MASIFFVLALLHLPAAVHAGTVGACDDNASACESFTGTDDTHALLQTKARLGESALSVDFLPAAREKGDALLLSLEDMMQSVKNGKKNANISELTIIKDMVDALVPSVSEAHAEATLLLTESIDRVNDCVSETADGLTAASATAASATALEDKHETCRNEEKIKFDDKTTKCNALDSFLADTVYPPIPDPITLETLEPVLNTYKRLAEELQVKKIACENATSAHAVHKSGCDGEQMTYEARFCEYRAELTTLKSDSSQCYADAKSSYDDISAATPGKVEKFKAQMKAFKKILCYLQVWLKSGTVDAAVAHECENTAIDTSELAINDPGIPEETLVDDSVVAVFPGSAGWLDKYADFPHNTAVVHCEAATGTTTTEAPTTTTATTTTEAAPAVEYVYTHVADTSKTCPEGYDRVMDLEECKAGVTIDGTHYQFRNSPPWNQGLCDQNGAYWPSRGCFLHSGEVFYSTCDHVNRCNYGRSAQDHSCICKKALS